MSLDEHLVALERKAAAVLEIAFRGLHHMTDWPRRELVGPGITLCVPNSLATYDFDALTRLVVAAHDQCVRLEISPCCPRHVRLSFHDRARPMPGDHTWQRHPELEEAIARIRAWKLA